MTSGTYYHFQFKPQESGYFKLCVNLSTGNTNNKLGWYDYIREGYYQWSASSTAEKSSCVSLGHISSGTYIKIYNYAYTDIATVSFSIQKVSTVKSLNVGIRYDGKNPNNYVWFNNEYWRIIGVFDSNSHGQSGKNLVKIIRAEKLGGLSWDKSNNNDWTTASLNSLLNGAYYNAQDGTNLGFCYGYSGVVSNCDYRIKGIQSEYRDMVANVTWYLGGYSSTSATAASFYSYERGTTVYSGRHQLRDI